MKFKKLFFWFVFVILSISLVSGEVPFIQINEDSSELASTSVFPAVEFNPSKLEHNDLGGFQGGNLSEYYHLNENVFSRLMYPAYAFHHNNKTLVTYGDGTWRNVSFNKEEGVTDVRITHTPIGANNVSFIIQDDGIYKLDWFLSFEDSAASPNAQIVGRLMKNGVEIHGSAWEQDSTKQNAELQMQNTAIVSLVMDDYLNLQFTSDDATVSLTSHLTYGDHTDSAVLTIVRIA